MANKTDAERIEALQLKQKQLKEQEKRIRARLSEKKRKARTKRLIEIGGVVEKVLGKPINKEDLPKLMSFLEQQERNGNYFSKAMQKGD